MLKKVEQIKKKDGIPGDPMGRDCREEKTSSKSSQDGGQDRREVTRHARC